VAFKKDGDYIDPTKYLEFKPVTMPEWKQECDDYKLVFKASIILFLYGKPPFIRGYFNL
jgi:hypothetical protein